MPDYKSMYFRLTGQVADAVSLLIEAQREGEAAYMEADAPPLTLADSQAGERPPERGHNNSWNSLGDSR